MRTYDVGIVGAGVHGAAAAFHLATRGIGVAIVERDGPAGGPTGRSSAICRAYYTNAFLASVARDSIAMMSSFEEHTGRTAGTVALAERGRGGGHPPGRVSDHADRA